MAISRASVASIKDLAERAERQKVLDRCMANDMWAKKIFKRVGVLMLTYPGQRAYLKSCIESHAKLGFWITLAYDNYIDPTEATVDHNAFMPDKEILDKVDCFLMPHWQTWKDVNYPYFWLVKWGVAMMQQFDYIFCTEGDNILEKPEGFEKLLQMMGDGDVMTCGPDDESEASTQAYLVKSKIFLQICQYMQDHFIPFEVFEKYPELGGAESRLRAAIRDLNLKMISVPEFPNTGNYHSLYGTWYDLIGLRHIQGELDYAFKYRQIPPHYKYLEEKYVLPIYNYPLVKEYWDTQDPAVLERWWKK